MVMTRFALVLLAVIATVVGILLFEQLQRCFPLLVVFRCGGGRAGGD